MVKSIRFYLLTSMILIFVCPVLISAEIPKGKAILVPADESIIYDWYYYVPQSLNINETHDILLIINGGDWDYQENTEVAELIVGGWVQFAEENGIILICASIPRGYTDLSTGYSHYTSAIPISSFYSDIEALHYRPDEKVNQMIDKLSEDLLAEGFSIDSEILIWGFSHQAMFANRYILLHPDRVKAASIGSPGGYFTMPEEYYGTTALSWAIGIQNFTELTGKTFNKTAYKKVPQFVYIGNTDDNTHFMDDYGIDNDFWTDDLFYFINSTFGKFPPDRIQNQCTYLQNLGYNNISFSMYDGVGHEVTDEMLDDSRNFLLNYKSKPEVISDIKANGSDSSVTTLYGNSTNITVSLNAGTKAKQDADWWIAVDTPFGWYSYVDNTGWQAGINLFKQEPLSTFSSTILTTTLPLGDYNFYFAIDDNMDGSLDVTWYDSVSVNVVELNFDFPFSIPNATITIDGKADDWAGIVPILNDSMGDSTCGSGTDIKDVYLAMDGEYLYWRMDTSSGIYKFNDSNAVGPDIRFYNMKSDGSLSNDIMFQMIGGGDNYSITTKDSSGNWTSYDPGSGYGQISDIAEGKIPLSLFSDNLYNWFWVGFYGNANVNDPTCDQVSQAFPVK